MNIKDNPVPLPDLTISEYETIMYALENMDKYPGLSGNAYRKLITKLEKLQNGVETNKEQPKDYWQINVNNECIEIKFYTEKDAIKKAKSLFGKKWEEKTEFIHNIWQKTIKGYYIEESYRY